MCACEPEPSQGGSLEQRPALLSRVFPGTPVWRSDGSEITLDKWAALNTISFQLGGGMGQGTGGAGDEEQATGGRPEVVLPLLGVVK